MLIEKKTLAEHNDLLLSQHTRRFAYTAETIPNVKEVITKLKDFQIAIPSWALGTGGTRFGRFGGGGEHWRGASCAAVHASHGANGSGSAGTKFVIREWRRHYQPLATNQYAGLQH